jgi:hypothetical protein
MDGKAVIDTYSEEYRHQCEVRTVLRWRRDYGGYKAHEYIDSIEKKRGKAAAERLMRDCQMQWSFGNRGQEGQWLDAPVAKFTSETRIAS